MNDRNLLFLTALEAVKIRVPAQSVQEVARELWGSLFVEALTLHL